MISNLAIAARVRHVWRVGALARILGDVIAATGTKRNGWMAYDALQVSDGCK